MGRVSRRRIDPEIEERLFEIFWDYLAHLKKPEEIKEFMISLLSYTEQVMLAKRLAIALLLNRELLYEEIDQTLKVSKSTVGTVHKQILIGAPGYIKAVRYIQTQEKLEGLLDTLQEIILKLSPPKAYKSPAWKGRSKAGRSLVKRQRVRSAI